MKRKWLYLFGLLGLALMLSSCGYNSLVGLDEDVKKQWGQVQTAYQRRADLIPNLVNTVKGYASFEKETLLAVTQARASATAVNISAETLTPEAFKQFQQAQQGVSSSLSRLLVSVEKYPELKANQNFLELQAQLEGTENRISVARNKFNEVTGAYNKQVRTFPGNLTAKAFGFTEKPYFEAEAGTEKAPTVTF